MLCARSVVEWFKEQSMQMLTKFLLDESGATAIEYALIAAIVSVVIVAGLNVAGPALNRTFTNVGNALNAANAG